MWSPSASTAAMNESLSITPSCRESMLRTEKLNLDMRLLRGSLTVSSTPGEFRRCIPFQSPAWREGANTLLGKVVLHPGRLTEISGGLDLSAPDRRWKRARPVGRSGYLTSGCQS